MTNPNESIQIDPGFRSLTPDKTKDRERSGGLTKREVFAAMAMQGLLAHNCDHFQGEDLEPTGIGKRSVDLADALITALNEGR